MNTYRSAILPAITRPRGQRRTDDDHLALVGASAGSVLYKPRRAGLTSMILSTQTRPRGRRRMETMARSKGPPVQQSMPGTDGDIPQHVRDLAEEALALRDRETLASERYGAALEVLMVAMDKAEPKVPAVSVSGVTFDIKDSTRKMRMTNYKKPSDRDA